jgi:hypothetical protein
MPALAIALALLLGVEWLLLPGPHVISPYKMPQIPAAQSSSEVDSAVAQWGDTSLARPLFQPDRRPVITADANQSTSLPRLSAILIVGGARAAVFAADGQKPQVVSTGGTIAGYRLERIAPDSVELFGPDGDLTVHPQFITTAPASGANNAPDDNNEISEEPSN